ncbi:MAG: aspartyl/glutamyl-tRNA amidotransferase subunit C [Bacteriovoracaceae bacterium]|nr:aspartyl/glutamyl-tRNA amidotransferase subunit C [Bacteriovoracaceae bacterium]
MNMKVNVDKNLLKHVAQLARLEFSESESDEYVKNLSNLLKYADGLQKAPTEGISPLYNPVEEGLMIGAKIQKGTQWENVKVSEQPHLHIDTEKKSLSVGEVLSNAPDQLENQIKINAVIEEL